MVHFVSLYAACSVFWKKMDILGELILSILTSLAELKIALLKHY